MQRSLVRAYIIELIGAFTLVYFGAGVVCVNYLTTPAGQQPGMANLLGLQPGLVGIALAQGLLLAVLLAVTVPLSGGYLNPAIAIMLWVFNRLDSARASWLIGAQLLGSALAALCLSYTFAGSVLREARLGTPHLNPVVFHPDARTIPRGALATGTGIEFALTFFLVFAMFGLCLEGPRPRLAARTAGILFALPLTGAATNPARWFGPALIESTLPAGPQAVASPFADAFVYTAGPIVGALLAGLVCFKLMLAAPGQGYTATPPKAADTVKAGSGGQRARK
jgi:glycerol uptake facilitator-like aquaporin